jgi:gamma-glutamylputrescine oxidase
MTTEIDTTAFGNSWYAATLLEAPKRPQLRVNLDVDVCVIGGGLAGLTTAREVARSGWSVVLLEAGRLAASASGRNTGFVLPGFGADADKLIARVGFERTKSLWALSEAGLDYVRNTVGAETMFGVDPQNGWLYVSKADNGEEFLRYARLLNDLGCEIESWPTERVRAVLRSERYFHAIHYLRAITIHPLNYAFALAEAAEADGARIFENTPALSIDPAGVRKRIVTPRARLRANHVVLCGNVQIGSLVPRLGATLLPITTYVITTASLGSPLAEAIGYQGAVSDTDLADNHYRIVGADRLMLSGRSTTWARNPRRYIRALTRDIKKTYPQLGDVTVDYAWSGTLGVTVHRMPQLGELGPGIWLASGFGGHGLNTTAMAGNLIARAIVHGDQTWRQFTPFELIWAGGICGRAVAQMRVWVKRFRDAIEERRARAHELRHRQAIEAELLLEAERADHITTDAAALETQDITAQDLAPRELAPRELAPRELAPPDLAQQDVPARDLAARDLTWAAEDLGPPGATMADADSIVPPPSGVDETPPPGGPSNPPSKRPRRRQKREKAKA